MLPGSQLSALSDALRATFDKSRLEDLFVFRLERSLDDISIDSDYRTMMRKVVVAANRQGWLDELVARAAEAEPRAPALQEVVARLELELISSVPSRGELQALMATEERMVDVDEWYRRIGELAGRVCRIEIGDDGVHGMGTGFLVGPDAVLTNDHVIRPVIEGDVPADRVIARFDYKRPSAGAPVHPGTPHRLAADWLLDSSPPSDSELNGTEGPPPTSAQLDYAMLRLSDRAGDEPVGGPTNAPDPPARGWVRRPRNPRVPRAGRSVVVLQHPAGNPLKIAIGPTTREDPPGVRLHYRVNTLRGSSGSPVLSANLDLVALHHWGDPTYHDVDAQRDNRAVPLTAILERIEQNATAVAALGDEEADA